MQVSSERRLSCSCAPLDYIESPLHPCTRMGAPGPGSPRTRGPQRAIGTRWGEGTGLCPWGGDPDSGTWDHTTLPLLVVQPFHCSGRVGFLAGSVATRSTRLSFQHGAEVRADVWIRRGSGDGQRDAVVGRTFGAAADKAHHPR